MKRIAMIAALAISNAHAQLDRAGNVIESDYSESGGGLNGLVFVFIGVLVGLAAPLAIPNLDAKFAMIAGGVVGLVVQIMVATLR
jgi:hypothetical protein